MAVVKITKNTPSYSIFSPSRKRYMICCEKCLREYEYNLSDADVSAIQRHYAGKPALSSVAEENVRIAEKFRLCWHCFMDAKEDAYKYLLYRAENRFKPMIEDYVFGGGRFEDIKLWLGEGFASAIKEYKEKYMI